MRYPLNDGTTGPRDDSDDAGFNSGSNRIPPQRFKNLESVDTPEDLDKAAAILGTYNLKLGLMEQGCCNPDGSLNTEALVSVLNEMFSGDVQPTESVVPTTKNISEQALGFVADSQCHIALIYKYLKNHGDDITKSRQNAKCKLKQGCDQRGRVLDWMDDVVFEQALADGLQNKKTVVKALMSSRLRFDTDDECALDDAKQTADYIKKLFDPDAYKLLTEPTDYTQKLNGSYVETPGNVFFPSIYHMLRAISGRLRPSDILGGAKGLSPNLDDDNICGELKAADALYVIKMRLDEVLFSRIGFTGSNEYNDEFNEKFNAYQIRQNFGPSMRASFDSTSNHLAFYLNACDWLDVSIDELFAPLGQSVFAIDDILYDELFPVNA